MAPLSVRRLPRRAAPAAGLALLLAAAGPGIGCGKQGPPRAPLRIVPAPARDLRVRQVGPDVVLTALLPGRRTDGSPLGEGAEVRVLRLQATATLRPGLVSARYLGGQFEKGARAVARLSGQALSAAAPGGRLRFADAGTGLQHGPPGGAGPMFLYSVQVFDAEGRRSPIPPPVAIAIGGPAPPPQNLRAETAEGEVRLAWDPPEAAAPEVDPSGREPAPPTFNVYRRSADGPGDAAERPLNPQPLAATEFVDRGFRYGESYRYTVRAIVALGPPLHESPGAAEVEIRPLDVYPPQAPGGLAAAAEGGAIRLYWFPNTEPDLGGYRIYRRPGPGGGSALVGQVGAAESSFTDAGAAPGVRYHYAVTAVDGTIPPNESPRSEERSEMLPAPPGSGAGADPGGDP